MTRPIRPEDIASAKEEHFPAAVIEAFNALIAEKAVNGFVRVRQEDVVQRLIDKGMTRAEIFANGWLNVEDIYRAAGWQVEYDGPGFNETYSATYTFREAR